MTRLHVDDRGSVLPLVIGAVVIVLTLVTVVTDVSTLWLQRRALQATVAHVHPIGPVVRVELQHGGEIVEVELSRERHESLQLAVGQSVWFRPRQMRVFGADNQPAAAPEKQAFLF